MTPKEPIKPRLTSAGWLTVPEAAEALALSDSTVYRLIRAERLDAVRVAGQLYVNRASLDAYLGADAAAVLASLAGEEATDAPDR